MEVDRPQDQNNMFLVVELQWFLFDEDRVSSDEVALLIPEVLEWATGE